jgi:hypothetical protein
MSPEMLTLVAAVLRKDLGLEVWEVVSVLRELSLKAKSETRVEKDILGGNDEEKENVGRRREILCWLRIGST